MDGVQLAALHEELQNNERRGQGDEETEEDGLGGGPAEYLAQGETRQGGQQDLGDAAQDSHAADAFKLVERELQTQGEKQQDDADAGQALDGLGVLHQAQAVRADQHAGNEIAEEYRQLQAMGQDAAGHRGHQHDDEFKSQAQVFHAPLRSS